MGKNSIALSVGIGVESTEELFLVDVLENLSIFEVIGRLIKGVIGGLGGCS